jgi:hypothetical protein
MIKKTIKLSDDKTVKIIDNEIGNYSITIIKENGYSVDTDKQELKELCKIANEQLADGITITNYRMLGGYKMMNHDIKEELQEILDNNQVRELFLNSTNTSEALDIGYEENMIYELLNVLINDTYNYTSDGIAEIADSFIEIYNQKLLQLYADNFGLTQYFEEAKSEGLMEGDVDFFQMMQMGQYKYNTYVLYSVIDYLNIFYKMR